MRDAAPNWWSVVINIYAQAGLRRVSKQAVVFRVQQYLSYLRPYWRHVFPKTFYPREVMSVFTAYIMLFIVD